MMYFNDLKTRHSHKTKLRLQKLLYVLTKETKSFKGKCDTDNCSIITVNVLIDSISVYLSSTLETSPRPQETGLLE